MLSHPTQRTLSASVFVALTALSVSSCYVIRPSSGAGEIPPTSNRPTPDPQAIVVPDGYVVEVVATGLTFPVGATFDHEGRIFVVESGYSYGEVFTTPRLLEIRENANPRVVASIPKGGPWTGVAYHDGAFFVTDGNVLEGGRLLRITPAGDVQALVTGLPSLGDHHTNSPIVSADGWIYFGQGTATNSGVVGEDNLHYGWLARHPRFHDVPAQAITLSGENFETADVLNPASERKAVTGAFLPFGTPSHAGQVIPAAPRPSGSIMRVNASGGAPEVVAWGFRNPFGLAFSPDGDLYVTENGADDRGSRKVWGAPDVLWRVQAGSWYGWPDFVAGMPITDSQFRSPGDRPLRFLLAKHPNPVPSPVAKFAVHASADGLDFSTSAEFGYEGEAFVAIFGDMAPTVGKILAPVAGRVERVDVKTGVITGFAINRGKHDAPATKLGSGGFERPVAARFSPGGDALYVVDFGVMRIGEKGPEPKIETGVLWRIRRQQ